VEKKRWKSLKSMLNNTIKIKKIFLILYDMIRRGFNAEKYLQVQSREILKRAEGFKKFYLEFGGKICDDFHAARVLPGYEPNTKIKMLQMIKDNSEIVFCISAKDIENGKMRGDFDLTYETMTLKSINDLRSFGLDVSAVIINRFSGEKKALQFKKYLENIGIKPYLQKEIEGYPANVEKIVSKKGYGQNPYVEFDKSIVVVSGVAPGSGKMSFCLSQLYHDYKRGINSGFAKFETFPVWDLPIDHPVNLAYEAATANIGDVNMLDPFHLREYGISAVNYNRDIENFPILRNILKKIGKDIYKSPTDMGVGKTKKGIIEDSIIKGAAKQEIIRRYFRYKKEKLLGIVEKSVVDKIEKLMLKLGLNENHRKVVLAARKCAEDCYKEGKGNNNFFCGTAIQLGDERIITGKNSHLLHSESAAIINALKSLALIPDDIFLLPENLIQNIRKMKKSIGGSDNPSLDVDEILIALSISAESNPSAKKCIEKISLLKNCEMHTTHLPSRGDEEGIRNLGINLTTDSALTPKIYLKK